MTIDDRLTAPSGTFFFSGLSMLVRLPLEQARRDRERGVASGTLITGYPGSPLGGYDLALARIGPLLEERHIRFLPAGNEEQAATALMGTQMLDDHPHSTYRGVNGFWYGKGPGVDRAGDAFKHGNFAGTSRHGAVVVLSGEDHEAKSSTMPFQEDFAFASAGIPVLYPSSVAEFRTLGLHAVALSRYSGCWVALKLTAPFHSTLIRLVGVGRGREGLSGKSTGNSRRSCRLAREKRRQAPGMSCLNTTNSKAYAKRSRRASGMLRVKPAKETMAPTG